jgi:nitrate reductase gamma subunit
MPESSAARIHTMLTEIILLEGIRKHHPALWIWSWPFHLSLYLLVAIAGLSLAASLSSGARDSFASVITVASFVTFALGVVGSGGLMARRLTSSKLRPLTSFFDLFNLTLLFALFLSGFIFVLIESAAAMLIIEQAGALLGINQPPMLHPLAILHLCLIALFIAYMPFTHMAHMVLKYFTYHSVRWDDRSAREVPQSAGRMAEYLAYPVKWSALHIQDGKTGVRWADKIVQSQKERKSERD